jgi:hypothetical protein
MAKQRRLRDGDELDDDDIVVVRGGDLDAEVLRSDAQDYFAVYGTYGLSVLAARDISVDELAQLPPLGRFEALTLMRVGVLRAAGAPARTLRSKPEALHDRVQRPGPGHRRPPLLRARALDQPVP